MIILKAAYLLLTVLRFIEGLDLTEFLQCAFSVMEREMGNDLNSLLKFSSILLAVQATMNFV